MPKPVKPAVEHPRHEFRGSKAYVYYDEKGKTWRIGNDVIERTIRFDRDAGALRTVAVKTLGRLPRIASVSDSEGTFRLAGTDTPIMLDHDWAYIWQSVSTPADGGRLLTIHLQGVRSHDGYEVEALYRVKPGDRPYLGKSLTFINRTHAPVTVREVTDDRWVLAATEKHGGVPGAAPVTAAASNQGGLYTLQHAGPAGESEGVGAFSDGQGARFDAANGEVIARSSGPFIAAPDGGRAYTPAAVVFPFRGGRGVASTLHRDYGAEAHTAER